MKQSTPLAGEENQASNNILEINCRGPNGAIREPLPLPTPARASLQRLLDPDIMFAKPMQTSILVASNKMGKFRLVMDTSEIHTRIIAARS